MRVVLKSHWFGPNGVLYRKGFDGAPVNIPSSLKNLLPKSAYVLAEGEKVVLRKNLPVDSRPLKGSGDPNADVPVEVARVNAEATGTLIQAAEKRAKKPNPALQD